MPPDLGYAAGFYLLFGGLPLTLLLVLARLRLSAKTYSALVLGYLSFRHLTNQLPFGLDSPRFRSLIGALILPLFESQGGRVILDGHIDPEQTYCVCGAPHGVVPLYFMGITSWFRYGPQRLNPIALGANVIFSIPLLREIFLCFALPGTPENFARLARAGRSVSLVPGGVPEMMLQQPGNKVRIVTKNTGFIKMSLEHGVHLLPVFAFGEHNMFEQVRPSHQVASVVAKLTGGWYPFFYRGEYLCIPKRGPVVICSAEPIPLPTIPNPSVQDVQHWHEIFYKSLSDLVQRYKKELPEFSNLQVEFIGKPHLNVDWAGGSMAKL